MSVTLKAPTVCQVLQSSLYRTRYLFTHCWQQPSLPWVITPRTSATSFSSICKHLQSCHYHHGVCVCLCLSVKGRTCLCVCAWVRPCAGRFGGWVCIWWEWVRANVCEGEWTGCCDELSRFTFGANKQKLQGLFKKSSSFHKINRNGLWIKKPDFEFKVWGLFLINDFLW